MLAVFAWSMALLRGRQAPSRRHDGASLLRSERTTRVKSGTVLPIVALLQVRGDGEWMVSTYRVRHYGALLFCWMCDVQLTSFAAQLRPGAPHRATLISHMAFVQDCVARGVSLSTIFNTPGLTILHFLVDGMHSFDLGPLLDILGSVLYLEASMLLRWRVCWCARTACARALAPRNVVPGDVQEVPPKHPQRPGCDQPRA